MISEETTSSQSFFDPGGFKPVSVGQRLREYRLERGFSIRELAEKSGLAVNTLSLIENQKSSPSVNTLAPFAASRLTEDVLPPDLFKAAKPDFVTPLVMYLVSDECTESGNIYQAGQSNFSRIAVVTGPGVKIGDGVTPCTVEEVRDQWDKIKSIEGAVEREQVTTQLVRPPK